MDGMGGGMQQNLEEINNWHFRKRISYCERKSNVKSTILGIGIENILLQKATTNLQQHQRIRHTFRYIRSSRNCNL